MTGIKRSLIIAFVTQYAELVIQFIGLMLLARVITSEQVGIFSVAAFLMALLHVFRDFGVARYIIQVDELTPAKTRSAVGVAYLLAWTVALVLYLCSDMLAALYHKPQIKSILIVMSASFAITPIGSILIAVLRRNMQLKRIAAVRIASTLSHSVVAVSMAYMGYGAMSLAWANFASILSFGLVAALLRPVGTPLMPSFRDMREILAFGSISSLGSVASVAGGNAPDVIIGKAISLEATGYFSRGNGMVQMFKTLVNGAILPLVMPYFAQLRRENAPMIEPYKLSMVHLTGLMWPFFTVMAIMAHPLVRVLYGDNWNPSVPIVQVLSIASLVSTLSTFATEVMIAYGHVARVTRLSLVIQPVRVVAILVACPFGLRMVAASIIVTEAVALTLTSRALYETNGVSFMAVLGATTKSVLLTLFSVVGPVAVMLMWPNKDHHEWLQVVLGGLGALGGWLIGVFVTHHPIKQHLEQAQLRYWPGAPWAKR